MDEVKAPETEQAQTPEVEQALATTSGNLVNRGFWTDMSAIGRAYGGTSG